MVKGWARDDHRSRNPPVLDLRAAIDFYQRLTGQPATRFAFGGAELAAVGPFLLFAAAYDVAERLSRAASISVDDVIAQARAIEQLGAEIVAPPSPTPNGRGG